MLTGQTKGVSLYFYVFIVSSSGIEKLKSLDRVLIRERCGSYTSSKYVVLTAEGAVLLHAREDSGILNKMLVGKSRAFEIDVFDTDDLEVAMLAIKFVFNI